MIIKSESSQSINGTHPYPTTWLRRAPDQRFFQQLTICSSMLCYQHSTVTDLLVRELPSSKTSFKRCVARCSLSTVQLFLPAHPKAPPPGTSLPFPLLIPKHCWRPSANIQPSLSLNHHLSLSLPPSLAKRLEEQDAFLFLALLASRFKSVQIYEKVSTIIAISQASFVDFERSF